MKNKHVKYANQVRLNINIGKTKLLRLGTTIPRAIWPFGNEQIDEVEENFQ